MSLYAPSTRFLARRFSARTTATAVLAALVAIAPAASRATPPAGERVRVVALHRAYVGDRRITLAGVLPEPAAGCVPAALEAVTAQVAGRRGRVQVIEGVSPEAGFVLLDDGRSVNELVLATGCVRFDEAGVEVVPDQLARLRAAWQRGQVDGGLPAQAADSVAPSAAPPPAPAGGTGAAEATGDWTILAKWTGAGEKTTEALAVDAGELRVVLLAIPRTSRAELKVVVQAEDGSVLQTISSGPLTTKQMDATPVQIPRAMRVHFAISGTDVFWGVWAQRR
jgi:hypothetical protein